MSQGYPDYFGQVAVPNWGPANVGTWTEAITSPDTGNVIDITDRGILEWAYISFTLASPDDVSGVSFWITVDGKVILVASLLSIWEWFGNPDSALPFAVPRADFVNGRFVIAYRTPIAFEDSYQVTVSPSGAITVEIDSRYFWRNVR